MKGQRRTTMMWTSDHHVHRGTASSSHSLIHSSSYASYSDASSCHSADEMPSSSSGATVLADDWRHIHCAADDLICSSEPATQSHTARQRPDTEELCLICGDRASGYHYNALSCEGCKGNMVQHAADCLLVRLIIGVKFMQYRGL